MARYLGPKAKLCRKFGENIFGVPKYDKILKRKSYAPGLHGKNFKKRQSEYGIHLNEKQKLRFTYCLMEKQFRNYFFKADKMKGVTIENLLKLLEMRFDNLIYRLGFAVTRMQARQFVSHGHFKINGKKVNIPSYICVPSEIIELKQNSNIRNIVLSNMDITSSSYEWLSVDKSNIKGEILYVPSREQIPVKLDDRLVVEYYSK